MNVSTISLERTNRFNRLILDYVNGDDRLNEFYGFKHGLGNYPKQIESRKQFPLQRDLLADSLIDQYKSIGGAKDAVRKNIDALRNENSFTVTTGHQLNIFTGPLYFIYKILHTIKLADELNEAYTDFHFIPVYWMNSEDHDLHEIAQFNLFGKKYVWETEQTGATGRMTPKGLEEFCGQLKEVFANNRSMLELVGTFQKAYTESASLGIATRKFANNLFGKYGLVIIDSDDAQLKATFVDYLKKDLVANRPFELVKETNQELDRLGYHHQVNPREINCFYLAKGIRNRIVRTEKGYHVLHTNFRFTEEELIEQVESHPERFSPNVVLRPLFQEFILPNLTYVGGAGELSYWLQYKKYFSEMGVSFPMLSLRNHFTLIDKGAAKRLNDLNLFPEDLFHSVEELIKGHVLEVSDSEVELDNEFVLLSKLYASLTSKAEDIDATLISSIEAEKTKIEKGLGQWKSRFTRGLKKQNEVSVNRIRNLHKKLFPNGYLQERHDNFMAFYAQDPEEFLTIILKATDPFDTKFRVAVL